MSFIFTFYQTIQSQYEENIVISEQLSWAITWDIADKIKLLKDARDKMWLEKQNLDKLNEVKVELDTEIQDVENNYNVLHESATILKEDIKEAAGLN